MGIRPAQGGITPCPLISPVQTAPKAKGIPMRVAIVENTSVTHHGQVGVALHEAAARIDLYKPWLDGRLPALNSFDALVVFGGEQNALADHSHPYLPDLAGLMAEAGAQDHAVLGICLGSQLMARGMGAQNQIDATPEFGWCEVSLTAEGQTDPVLRHLPPRFSIFQWHSDTFSLPQGVTHLAQSTLAASQCFRAYRAAYAMQFHFEASRAVVADWTRTFGALMESSDPGWHANHPERSQRFGAEADAHGLALARAWVQLV